MNSQTVLTFTFVAVIFQITPSLTACTAQDHPLSHLAQDHAENTEAPTWDLIDPGPFELGDQPESGDEEYSEFLVLIKNNQTFIVGFDQFNDLGLLVERWIRVAWPRDKSTPKGGAFISKGNLYLQTDLLDNATRSLLGKTSDYDDNIGTLAATLNSNNDVVIYSQTMSPRNVWIQRSGPQGRRLDHVVHDAILYSSDPFQFEVVEERPVGPVRSVIHHFSANNDFRGETVFESEKKIDAMYIREHFAVTGDSPQKVINFATGTETEIPGNCHTGYYMEPLQSEVLQLYCKVDGEDQDTTVNISAKGIEVLNERIQYIIPSGTITIAETIEAEEVKDELIYVSATGSTHKFDVTPYFLRIADSIDEIIDQAELGLLHITTIGTSTSSGKTIHLDLIHSKLIQFPFPDYSRNPWDFTIPPVKGKIIAMGKSDSDYLIGAYTPTISGDWQLARFPSAAHQFRGDFGAVVTENNQVHLIGQKGDGDLTFETFDLNSGQRSEFNFTYEGRFFGMAARPCGEGILLDAFEESIFWDDTSGRNVIQMEAPYIRAGIRDVIVGGSGELFMRKHPCGD
jgi:hypothetical protein